MPAARSSQLDALNRRRRRAGQIIADLADAVHAVTLVKAAGDASADPAASEAERARAADLAGRLPMPALARAWQMLLKGYEEVREPSAPAGRRRHGSGQAGLRRRFAVARRSGAPPGRRRRRKRGRGRSPARRKPRAGPSPPGPRRVAPAPKPRLPRRRPPRTVESPAPPAPLPELKASRMSWRWPRRNATSSSSTRCCEQVRLVQFKPGTIEINPLPHAPRELGQELMRKLKAWTGRVWMVAVGDQEGAAPLGVQRRDKRRPRHRLHSRAPGGEGGVRAFPRRAHRCRAAGGRARRRLPKARTSRKSSRKTEPTR